MGFFIPVNITLYNTDVPDRAIRTKITEKADKTRTIVSNTAVAVLVLVAITALVWTVRRRRKKMEE